MRRCIYAPLCVRVYGRVYVCDWDLYICMHTRWAHNRSRINLATILPDNNEETNFLLSLNMMLLCLGTYNHNIFFLNSVKRNTTFHDNRPLAIKNHSMESVTSQVIAFRLRKKQMMFLLGALICWMFVCVILVTIRPFRILKSRT